MNRVETIQKLRETLFAERAAEAGRRADPAARGKVTEILDKHRRRASQIIAILQDLQPRR